MRRQRVSEPRQICFVLDGTQKITRNSRSHLGQGLVKYRSKFTLKKIELKIGSSHIGLRKSVVFGAKKSDLKSIFECLFFAFKGSP